MASGDQVENMVPATENTPAAENPDNVPDDDRARLMYYLDCVLTTMEQDLPHIDRFRRYQDYHLTRKEESELYVHGLNLSAEKLFNKCIYPTDKEDHPDKEMVKLSELTGGKIKVITILFLGRQITIRKVMIVKASWITKYWEDPSTVSSSHLFKVFGKKIYC